MCVCVYQQERTYETRGGVLIFEYLLIKTFYNFFSSANEFRNLTTLCDVIFRFIKTTETFNANYDQR